MGAALELVKNILNKNKALPGTPLLPATRISGEMIRSGKTLLPATLPAIPAPGGISVPAIRESLLPATQKYLRKPVAEHSAEDRALRDEKVLFVRLVEEYKTDHPKTGDQAAVSAVVRERSGDFPRLVRAGKNGKSALHYANFRNWRDGTSGPNGKPGLRNPVTGQVEYSRADLLLKNYGATRERCGDEVFWTELLAECNNQSAPRISKIYRRMVQKYTVSHPGAVIPTEAMVRYELGKLPKRLLDLNRKGENYYLQHCRDYNERDPDSIRPNEGWVADTQECDFFIRTPDPEKGGVRAVRPWICVIMDIKSEHVIAWEMGIDTMDNTVIRNAFARGVSEYGRPFVFLTDNGKDYLKQGFTEPVIFTPRIAGSDVYAHSIMIELDVEHRKAEVYNARVKIVERFFHEMAEYYRHLRGYAGNRPENRPASADVWTKPVNAEYLMSMEEACAEMWRFMDLYHDTPAQNSKYLKGMTPEEAFDPENRLNRPCMTYADYYRAFLLPEPKPRILDARGPSFKVDNQRYVVLRDHREKAWKYDGKPVMIKFDLNSRDYCFLFDLNGTFIGAAHKPELLPYFCRTPEEKARLDDHQEAIRSELKQLKTWTYDLTKGFHKLDVASCYALPPEEFEERAKLRKLDSKHSVKGETHNPAVYITKNEEDQHPKAQHLKTVCTKEELLPATVKEKTIDTEFQRKLIDLLGGEELTAGQSYLDTSEKEDTEHDKFIIPNDF